MIEEEVVRAVNEDKAPPTMAIIISVAVVGCLCISGALYYFLRNGKSGHDEDSDFDNISEKGRKDSNLKPSANTSNVLHNTRGSKVTKDIRRSQAQTEMMQLREDLAK